MVRGLDLFREFFAAHADQYVLIGGTAATLEMEAAGLPFRATKDLDVVLHIEALDAKFGESIWRFIEAGKYEIRQASATGKPIFYRFQKPADENYPAMLELFSRAPEGIALAPDSHLTPIPIDEAVASLSAILLDNDYYEFVLSGRRELDGLPWVGEDRLIPLKAVAWLDMKARASRGEAVDARDVRKHANDVLRLSQLLAPDSRIHASLVCRGGHHPTLPKAARRTASAHRVTRLPARPIARLACDSRAAAGHWRAVSPSGRGLRHQSAASPPVGGIFGAARR